MWVIPDKSYFPKATPDEKFKPEKFAEFGVMDDESLMKQIDEFYRKIRGDSDSTGYIINYGKASVVEERELKLRNSIRRCHHCRIVFVRGKESRELKTILWFVPFNAELPTP